MVLLFIALCLCGGLPALAAVHAGDELAITVYNHPELSQKVTISPQGTISLPLAGTISVVGLQPKDIAAKLRASLSTYIRNAAVDVAAASADKSIFITGGPGGILPYQIGETLSTVVLAINKTDNVLLQRSSVDLRRVGVIRDNRQLGTYNLEAAQAGGMQGPSLLPGDTVVLVNKPVPVRIYGQVKVPGTTFLTEVEPLSNAVTQAYGITPDAATSRVVLTRGGTSRIASLSDDVFSQPAQSGDAIEIPAAPKVSVTGKVAQPGTVTLHSDFSLLSAVYSAGGPAKEGDISKIEVVHNGVQHRYDLTQLSKGIKADNPTLTDGDVVFVPTGKQGTNFSTIFQALSAAAYLGLRI